MTHWFGNIKIGIVLFLAVVALVPQPILRKTQQLQELQVPGVYHKQAIDIALKVTGFDTAPGILASARREVLAKDNTPLLHKRIVGRPLWRITISPVKVSSRDGKRANPHIH